MQERAGHHDPEFRLQGLEPRRCRRAASGRLGFLRQAVHGGGYFQHLGVCFHYAMLWIIDRITPVRVDAAHEENGLDAGLHGEQAYPQGL